MVKTISPEAIQKATGKSWEDWLVFFNSIGASQLSHQEIAQKAGDLGGAPSWWRQMVTVVYEQHIGRRVPGQDCDGHFATSASKTITGDSLDHVLERWKQLMKGTEDFAGVPITRGPDVTKTEKWRYWRCGLADGSRLSVNISYKADEKISLSVQHERIESPEQVNHWRDYWNVFLKSY
jgi:hypothetical protein